MVFRLHFEVVSTSLKLHPAVLSNVMTRKTCNTCLSYHSQSGTLAAKYEAVKKDRQEMEAGLASNA